MSEKYSLIKQLGEGSYGKCFLVESQSKKEQFVIKQIDVRHMSQQEREQTVKEASILGCLDHPYIIKLKEAFFSKKGKLCIVMDYADGGDLNALIKTRKGEKFSEDQIISWFVQICLALKHIHDRKILHRDLKSQNIFMNKDGSIKLGDFGIAKMLSQTMENAKTIVGTPYYLSPELIDNKPYNFKSDIWSMGVLLYEMCALVPPFQSNSIHGLALKIVRGTYAPLGPEYSRELKLLLASLLSVDAKQRPSIHEVLKIPLILRNVQKFLTESQYNEEFSHTIIHVTPVLEESSARKKKKMLHKILKRRKELETSNDIKERTDKEKIICEMSALVLEGDSEELTAAVSEGNEDEQDNQEENEEVNVDKAQQFRLCLEDMMGAELFEEVYMIVKHISLSDYCDNFDAYFEQTRHLLNHKLQKQYVPMIKALIEMEQNNT
ncbi:hypothetical protein SteCoe_29150 [Stentor coeruleus]|uniref:non-specific serine/threonine protein kinase n=1 Tax=Stentor coeruleus TaxID=5963 RepID=A0A1R2B6N3_9CILI|nr:hypothetical protein SteCoe_29150 [Stentor coeruleus]